MKPIWDPVSMLLDVNDLHVHYDKVEAVKGVSLAVEAGGIITLIGANGAGKTSILKAISGVLRRSAGSIGFDDRRIDRLPAHRIVDAGIAHVPEGRRLFGLMTVRHNLRIGAWLQRDRDAIRQGFERVYRHFPILRERENQLARTLSGGQQQMVAIGRALMAQPRLVLMDEPSLGLAPIMVAEIANIIRELRDDGLSIVLVEQNASLALRLADRGYVLETGKVVLEGSSGELARNDYLKKAYLGG